MVVTVATLHLTFLTKPLSRNGTAAYRTGGTVAYHTGKVLPQ